MNSVIFVDNLQNGKKLKEFLIRKSPDLSDILIVNKKNISSYSSELKSTNYIFSTWSMPKLTASEISIFFPKLQAIFYAAGDTRYFEKPFLAKSIKIYSAIEENSLRVAEYVLAQILLSNKGYFQSSKKYSSQFNSLLSFREAKKQSINHFGNLRSKIGIIGLGTVGSKLAEKLNSFNFKVYAYDPYIDDSNFRSLNVTRKSLQDIFKDCHIITNHLPDNSETKNLINYEYFKLMMKFSTFINTGRGNQIVEADLIKAMKEDKTRTALLDVTRKEPVIPFSSILRTKNIFLTPHIAGSQGNEIYGLYEKIFKDYCKFIEQ